MSGILLSLLKVNWYIKYVICKVLPIWVAVFAHKSLGVIVFQFSDSEVVALSLWGYFKLPEQLLKFANFDKCQHSQVFLKLWATFIFLWIKNNMDYKGFWLWFQWCENTGISYWQWKLINVTVSISQISKALSVLLKTWTG